MCSWRDLSDGSLTMQDLMRMHRSLNLKGYLEKQAEKLNNPQR